MEEHVETPTDDLGSLSLYQADQDPPDYVSSAGSSVSQSKKTTIEMDAEMVSNAMNMITTLQQQVNIVLLISTVDIN